MQLDGLTPERLRVLYRKELLSDDEIARRYNTYQVKISRLRAKWGISTWSKGTRVGLQLPDLTPVQEQLLVGSLLGDGSMSATSGEAVRFGEGHGEKQAAYTEWKAHLMEPFTSSIRWGIKKEKGRIFRSRIFITHSCPQFRPFYDLFYPAPGRSKVFPSDLPDWMTPFVLAVWYMDDGSVTPTGTPRISFGLSKTSLKRARRALRSLGLEPRVYGPRGNQEILFPKQEREFLDLIQKHLIPEMTYKTPLDTPRRQIDRNARKLTPERAKTMYEGGLSKEQVALAFDVGVSTVGRRLRSAGTVMRRSGPRKRVWAREKAERVLQEYDTKRWATLPVEEQDRWANDIFTILRESGFPDIQGWDPEEARIDLEKLRGFDIDVGRDEAPRSSRGTQLCGSFFSHRFRASWRGGPSAFEDWHTDKGLMRSIRFQLKMGDPVTPRRVLRAISMQRRTPTIFKPAVAQYLYERYGKGKAVWDPCMGYGGRLMGAIAAGVAVYVGTDVDEETVEGNRRLAEALGVAKYQVSLHEHPAETFNPPEVGMVFTSPPYFDVELYSGGEDQSSIRYGDDLTQWTEGFLRPVVRTARRALSEGPLVINIADVNRYKKEPYPLVQITTDVALGEGFELTETLKMPLSALNRDRPWEPLLVFR